MPVAMATITTDPRTNSQDPKNFNPTNQTTSSQARPPMVISKAEAMNPHRRTTMEDLFVSHPPGSWGALDENIAYFAVYDGHGGREMVDFLEHGLSYHVAQEMNVDDGSDVTTRMERAFLMADIHSLQSGVSSSGATVALCLVERNPITPNKVRIIAANAGDSRVVLCHGNTVQRLTYDHRCDDPQEIARIEQAGGFLLKGRVMGVLALTRSLGDHALKQFVIAHPHVREESINLNEDGKSCHSFIIIACDGLWDVMSDRDACNMVMASCDHKKSAATRLVQESLSRGTADNVTAVVVWL